MRKIYHTRNAFAGYHPLIAILFFMYVILVPLVTVHPIIVSISFTLALAYAILLGRKKALRFCLSFVLPLMLIAVLLNPLINHRGATALFYLFNTLITLEASMYGVCMAGMIGSVILWFYCYNASMSSDMLLHVFGRVLPTVALIISMTLSFLPRYTRQVQRVAAARRGIGLDVRSDSLFQRIRGGASILMTLVSWAFENGVETSDSMLARGYGLPKRSRYSIYRFDKRDKALLAACIVLIAAVCAASFVGSVSAGYFPLFALRGAVPALIIAAVCHALVCCIPLMLALYEKLRWRRIDSKVIVRATKDSFLAMTKTSLQHLDPFLESAEISLRRHGASARSQNTMRDTESE